MPEGMSVPKVEFYCTPFLIRLNACHFFSRIRPLLSQTATSQLSQPIILDPYLWDTPMNGHENEYIPSNQEGYTPSNDALLMLTVQIKHLNKYSIINILFDYC